MVIIAILIVLSIVMYVYDKVTILKTKHSLSQKYINAQAKMCLGCFLIFFAINQYIAYQVIFLLFIIVIFFVLGIMQIVDGFKRARHYKGEWNRLHPEK